MYLIHVYVASVTVTIKQIKNLGLSNGNDEPIQICYVSLTVTM